MPKGSKATPNTPEPNVKVSASGSKRGNGSTHVVVSAGREELLLAPLLGPSRLSRDCSSSVPLLLSRPRASRSQLVSSRGAQERWGVTPRPWRDSAPTVLWSREGVAAVKGSIVCRTSVVSCAVHDSHCGPGLQRSLTQTVREDVAAASLRRLKCNCVHVFSGKCVYLEDQRGGPFV